MKKFKSVVKVVFNAVLFVCNLLLAGAGMFWIVDASEFSLGLGLFCCLGFLSVGLVPYLIAVYVGALVKKKQSLIWSKVMNSFSKLRTL